MDENTDTEPTPSVEHALDVLWRAQQRVMHLHERVVALDPERQRLRDLYHARQAQGPVEGDDLLRSWGRLYGDLCSLVADLAEQHVAMSTAMFNASMAYAQLVQEAGVAIAIPVIPSPPPYLN